MCDPGTAIMLAGTLLSTIGTIQQVNASNAQAAFQAQVARNNAIVQQQLAADAIRRGQEDVDAVRRRTAEGKGRQRSAFAAGGVVVDQDTPLDLLLDITEMGEMDALRTLDNSRREAFQFQVGATNDLAQAALFDAQKSSPLLAGATTLLGGLGSAISDFNAPNPTQTLSLADRAAPGPNQSLVM